MDLTPPRWPALSVAAMLLLAFACAPTARITRSEVAADLSALSLRAEMLGQYYGAEAAAGRLSRKDAEAWNAYLAGFKREFQALTDRAQVAATPAALVAVREDTARLGATLRPWER